MDLGTLYPSSIEINEVLGKARFFMNGTWIEIGSVKFVTTNKYCIDIQIPDIEKFLLNRELADDGTLDWYKWGPRVN